LHLQVYIYSTSTARERQFNSPAINALLLLLLLLLQAVLLKPQTQWLPSPSVSQVGKPCH
jgi:hypothetical protein